MSDNFVLGAGYIYFALEDANGNLGPERYIGDTPGFELAIETDAVQAYSSDPAIAEKVVDIATQVDRNATITCRNISGENLALFLIGDRSVVSQGALASQQDTATVNQGETVQLGTSASAPSGARDITLTSVTGAGATPTYTEGDDYTVDLELGRVSIVEGGGIPDGTDLEINYDIGAADIETINTVNTGAKYGACRFIGDNSQGENRDVYIPRAQLQPGGSFAVKSRDTLQELSFALAIGKRGDLDQIIVTARPV